MTTTFVFDDASSSDSELAKIEGQIFWKDGGSLPPISKISVRVYNSSLADKIEILAQHSFLAQGPSPLDFQITYQPTALDLRVMYSITVRIDDPERKLLYITKINQPVIKHGQQEENIKVLVEPV